MSPSSTTNSRDFERRVDQVKRQIGALKNIGFTVESTMSFDEVLTQAVKSTTRVMNADRTTLFLIDDDGALVSRVLEGNGITEIRLAPGQGFAGWTARHACPLLVKDAYTDERFDPAWDQRSGYRTKGVMCYPISGRNGLIIGVAEVLNKKHGEFERGDLDLLGVVCAQLSMTIENSRMMLDLIEKNRVITEAKTKLEKRNRELGVLLEIERIVARAEDLDSLVTRVFARVLEILDAELGCLYTAGEDGAQNRICSADGSVNALFRVDPGSGFTGWSAGKGEELCIPEPAGDPRVEESIQKRVGKSLRNVAVVPLPFTDQFASRGSLLVANRNREGGFDESDMVLLRLAASQLALAVEHLTDRLFRERDRRLATVGRLLAGVLHDLKTPITVISGYAELLAEAAGTEESRGYLEHVNRALARITTMTGDIVSFSKGEKTLLIHACHLNDLVDEFVQQVEAYLHANSVDLVVRMRTSGSVKLDREKMLRVFGNLVSNAVESMPSGGQIIFEVDRIGQEIVFSFTDTGSGIPETIQGTLFHSFVTLGKEHGTGLGLALVKEIVEGHGGRVNYSTSRGGGTTFLINLPVHEQAR